MRETTLCLFMLWLVFGCAHTRVEHWDAASGNKISEYNAFGVFRNDISVTHKTGDDTLKMGVNRPGLSDNGLAALQVAPQLADEIGNTIQGTQAIDALAESKIISGALERKAAEKAAKAAAGATP